MSEFTSHKNDDEMVMRCPFCKARVQNIDAECPICGETLTAQNVLRVKASVKIFSRPLLAQVDEAARAQQPATITPEPVAVTPPVAPTPPISKPRTEPLKPPRPLTQANPRVSTKNSRQPSGYTVGLLVGFAVIVLGAAILVGVNLARQATTEAKATADQKREQAAKITVVYQAAEPTQTPPVPTVTMQPTAISEVTLTTSFVVFTATSSSAIATQPTIVAPTPTPTLKPTQEIIPIFSPTPTQKPTLAPTATRRPATATPTQPPSATPAPTQTPQPSATFTPAPTKVVATWQLALASARYETSGRPTQACSNFDANDTVRKFTFTLRITQSTGRDLAANDWGVAAFVGDARVQQVCYFKAEGPTPPALPNGAERQITLSAFVSQGQSITALVVGDTTGSSEKICVKDMETVACK